MSRTPALRLSAEHGATEAETSPVVEGLRAFNRRHTPPPDPKPLVLLLRDDSGAVRGGLLATTRWHWLMVHQLWVEEAHRGRGHGRSLLERAESIARERGCRRAALDTAEYQARAFYERQGYRVFGELVDYPPGFRTFYLRKDLAPGPGEAGGGPTPAVSDPAPGSGLR